MDPRDEQMNELEDMVQALARRFCPSAGDVDDACQEARVALWQALPGFDEGRGQLRGFAWRVLRNHFCGQFRKQQRAQQRRMAAEAEFCGDYYAPKDAPEARVNVAQKVDRLPAMARFVVLSMFEWTEEGAIARRNMSQRLGMTPRQTQALLRRALKTLRQQLTKP